MCGHMRLLLHMATSGNQSIVYSCVSVLKTCVIDTWMIGSYYYTWPHEITDHSHVATHEWMCGHMRHGHIRLPITCVIVISCGHMRLLSHIIHVWPHEIAITHGHMRLLLHMATPDYYYTWSHSHVCLFMCLCDRMIGNLWPHQITITHGHMRLPIILSHRHMNRHMCHSWSVICLLSIQRDRHTWMCHSQTHMNVSFLDTHETDTHECVIHRHTWMCHS